MTAYKCDLCGNYYDKVELDISDRGFYKYREEGRPITKLIVHVPGISQDLDLCPDCGEKIKSVLGDAGKLY